MKDEIGNKINQENEKKKVAMKRTITKYGLNIK
jgi:hypothetical protein